MTPTGKKRGRKGVDYSGVDWETEFSSDIAKRLGVTEAAISCARRRFAPHTLRTRKKQSKPAWDAGVDWTMRNKDIAAIFGKKPGAVAAMRKVRAPQTVKRYLLTGIRGAKARAESDLLPS